MWNTNAWCGNIAKSLSSQARIALDTQEQQEGSTSEQIPQIVSKKSEGMHDQPSNLKPRNLELV